MARIIYCHPSRTDFGFHIYTDLDFWDAFRILKDLVTVKRNFGTEPSGDEFPTQVTGNDLDKKTKEKILHRLEKAITSPPRHVLVRSMIMDGFFEFDPRRYFPQRWPTSRMMHFTYHRLPLDQSVLNSPHKTVKLLWKEGKICIQRVQRQRKYDPAIRSKKESQRRKKSPLCF